MRAESVRHDTELIAADERLHAAVTAEAATKDEIATLLPPEGDRGCHWLDETMSRTYR